MSMAPAAPTPVLVIGEALVDIVDRSALEPDGSPQEHVGGSPANVAVGLARLGHPVRLATQFGTDPHGDLIDRHLRAEQVALTAGTRTDAPTSTALATLDQSGSAHYRFALNWNLPRVDLGDAHHVHTGSIAATLAPGAEQVRLALTVARSAGLTTSYDPNARPQIMGPPDAERPRIEALIAVSDVVKASDEDIAWLYPGRAPAAVIARWLERGPALVVLTEGGHGASAWTSADPHTPLTAVRQQKAVVDTVGAGDSFMAGLLSGLLDAQLLGGEEARVRLHGAHRSILQETLDRAALTAAITCGRAGAQPPTRAELA